MPPHFDLTVSSATLDQVLGFLAAKGFAVDFDARSMTLYGAGSTGSDTDSSRSSSGVLESVVWYAVIRGLQVGVCPDWPSALDWMVDEFGVRVPGTHALDFPTQAIAHRAFYVAVRRNEVKIIPAQVRDYIVVE